ncbi:prepilin peptidase [Tenuibacillus multivorans]|uniref:Leader peptidase (Prepilin peptidase) / N-methyltransferase n=1 Tax=Tenuibacillus multivorans TaxID=237069 RepID=A0A1H0FZK9_9BACI|nr:A24 family peptidase [Tenuibacillus multivorans]GEL78146.1 type 4 prepilin-like proteins leader peptide-processing enzyme [Tenuibacillus multivorans]SDN99984.1 leader peptidase (prepilin peptidase) / N-methyltransferase [Tenuibacillus multivorans]
MLFIYLYVTILGLMLGSFYNVVGIRVPRRESIVSPPSHCPKCEKRLRVHELIPVFSYVFQKGKCRHCQERISPLYPLFELLTAFLFGMAFYYFGFQLELIVAWALISLLVIITITDIHYQLIPNRILSYFVIILIILRLFVQTDPWYDAYLGGMVGFVLLLIIALISRGGMGGGDIKLFGVIGLVLGVKGTLMILFLASLLGAVIGFILMVFGKVKKGVPFAFGPFIALGAILTYFYQNDIIEWYTQTFFL